MRRTLQGRPPKTVTKNRNVLGPLLAVIGARKLRDLSADDVRQALAVMAGKYSTAAVSMGHLTLKRAIRHAEADDLVARNVAVLADTPKGQGGRPSRSFALDQALAVMTAAATLPVMELRPGLKDVRRPAELMHAYITLSLLAGIRTEEARALQWEHVDLDGDPDTRPPLPPHIAVWRSVRAHGDTKTERSRRTLALPATAIQALTPNSRHANHVETEILLADALAQLGVQSRQTADVPDQGIDLVIEPGGTRVQVKRRALVTDEVARRLLGETPRLPDSVLLVVGDRVTETARRLLVEHRAGYYDLRGHLALRSANVVIDADVEPVSGRVERTNALSGSAGLEVAAALLMEPAAGVAVRELARRLGRAASTVSEVLATLRGGGLVDDRHHVEGTQLFWQVAERWPAASVHLAQLPMPGDKATIAKPLRLGLDNAENTIGWALTDSAAAVAYGAPLAVRAGQLLDFYVPDQAILRRATALLGTAPSRSQARCAVRVAPVRAACTHRVEVAANPFEWPLAHPVFVALDLAQDTGRGREILGAWTPPERWARVW